MKNIDKDVKDAAFLIRELQIDAWIGAVRWVLAAIIFSCSVFVFITTGHIVI